MKQEIKLNSRYNENNRLVRINDEELKYLLVTELDTYRAGLIDGTEEQYSFIDPPGGPFITIGTEIDGHKVKAIYKGGIIEFES